MNKERIFRECIKKRKIPLFSRRLLTTIYPLIICLILFPSTSMGEEGIVIQEPFPKEIVLEKSVADFDEFEDHFTDEFDDEFDDANELSEVYDPIEPVNRAIFWFNDKLYFAVLKPAAKVYRYVPEQARVSVSNFFSNIWSPIRFANLLLQLKFKKSGNELIRFVTNSTIGVLGLFDPADSIWGIKLQWEDLGQTLGHYGLGHGFYLVLPGLGPSSLRDALGLVGDTFVDPFYYLFNTYENIGVRAAYRLNYVSLDKKDTYDAIKRDAIDPYIFVRNAYYQYRSAVIEQ